MENRFKMRISRVFKSSFSSCKSKNISDVVIDDNKNNKPVFYPPNSQHYKLVDVFSTKHHRLSPYMSTPKCSKNVPTQQSNNILPSSGGRKTFTEAVSIYCHNSVFSDGQTCPPASPIFPHDYQDNKYYERTAKKKTKTKKKKKTTRSKIKRFGFEELPNFYYKGLFSSDDEDEDDDKTNFFSSRSFTNSDSSESFRQHNKKKVMTHTRQRRASSSSTVKGTGTTTSCSLAVVKKSSDPYGDFRESMLEMIIENQIFGVKELEKLLECFLSLNSQHHHRVILQVFTEICEALLIL